MQPTVKRRNLIYLIPIIIIVILLLPFIGIWSIVGAGHIGVVTRLGAVNRSVEPGIVFKLPLIEIVHPMETRIQKEQTNAQAASKDLQDVQSTIALNYHLSADSAEAVYQDIGTNYKERIIDPAMQEAFKATTAKFTAGDLIGKREDVKSEVERNLEGRLAKFHIVVDNFNIVNFNFSSDFANAIEQKQVAQQNLERAKLEAQTEKTKAEGQAQAQKALKDTGSLSSEYLQFLAVQKWNGVLPQATGGNTTPFINIPNR